MYLETLGQVIDGSFINKKILMLKMSLVSWWNLSRQFEDFIKKWLNFENYRDWVLDKIDEMKNDNMKVEWWQLVINPKRAPLSVSTSKARARRTWYYKKSPNRPGILRWTWNLQDNITKIKNRYSCALVMNAKYAIYHQDGKGSKHRAMFEFNPRTKAEVVRIIQTQFNDEIGIWNARKS